ncbi:MULTISPECIES: hypothetical protein [unclassified Pseudoalteromonas]|uniref:hypothetical protein n=1 Tax=unclassified Pseudoalteromonas TaxID=194690 RepID=UPI0005AA180F|nr:MULTISPECIES: hypothetical protein [unclassified Pseudoalteromonas]
MINYTDDLIIPDEDKFLKGVSDFLVMYLDSRKKSKLPYLEMKSPSSISLGAFEHYLFPELKTITLGKVRVLYQVTLIPTKDPKHQKVQDILKLKTHSSYASAGIFSTCTTMFQWLWEQGLVVLSIGFPSNPNIRFTSSIKNEIFEGLFGLVTPEFKRKGKHYQTYLVSLKFLRMTDWKTWQDVSLKEYWSDVRDRKVTNAFGKRQSRPENLFKIALENGAEFTQGDLSNVFNTGAHHTAASASLEFKLNTLEQLAEYLDGIKTLQSGLKVYNSSGRELEQIANKVNDAGISITSPLSLPPKDRLMYFASNNDMDNYCKHVSAYSKSHKTLNYMSADFYPGLSVDPQKEFPDWCYVIAAFFKSLEKKTPSIISRSRRAIGHLADYLFVYLFDFYASNPDAIHHLPVKMQDFSRVIFWEQSVLDGKMSDNAPKTLIDWISSKVTTPKPLYHSIDDFFQFATLNFNTKHPSVPDAPLLKDFVNPVDVAIDVKQSAAGMNNPNKPTDKVAMPMCTLPFVHNTLKVLNEIHCQLQKILIEDLNAEQRKQYLQNNPLIKLADWGLECSFELNKETVRFDVMPNLFSWNNRVTKDVIPTLSCFRMLRTNVHAGQRMENIQWLDINNFDKLAPVKGYFQPIWIDIDKVFENRVIKVPTYIYDELQAEKEFQRKYTHVETDPVISTYSDTLISPLFKSFHEKSKGVPVSDTSYAEMWVDILHFIQIHYNKFAPKSEQHNFVQLRPKRPRSNVEPYQWNYGEAWVDLDGIQRPGNASAVFLYAIHTPHSMRNTYAVARKGLISTEDIKEQQGWLTDNMMFHYQQAQHQTDTDKQLELADKAMMEGTFLLGNNAIKPSESDSAMKASLNAGAKAVIEDQGMISISVPEFNEYSGVSGREMLIAQQRSVKSVVYDHCICPAGGDCPKEIVTIIGESKRCGLCPIACYGIDNISGLNARINDKRRSAGTGLNQVIRLEKLKVDVDTITPIKTQISLDQTEASVMRMTVGMLKKKLESGKKKDQFICRRPDMVKDVVEISINTDSEKGAFLSRIIEAQQHPEYCHEDFIRQCYFQYKKMNKKGFKDDESDPVGLVAGHLSALMQEKGVGFDKLLASPQIFQLSEVI